MSMIDLSMASVALPRNPLTADETTAIASNTEYRNPPVSSSPATDPQHSMLTTALTIINVLRSCLSTYVPPKTPNTCCAIIDAEHAIDPGYAKKIGVDIVKKALTAPVATIAKNAGFEGAVVVDKVAELPAGQGLNSANGEWGDMIEMGVLDPVKVSRVTLQNAASVASLILITEATVSDVPKNTQLEDAIAAATAGQQGGGMY